MRAGRREEKRRGQEGGNRKIRRKREAADKRKIIACVSFNQSYLKGGKFISKKGKRKIN